MKEVVIMKRRDAETEPDAFNAQGDGPMHEKLRAAYDSFLRGHPNLDPEQCFALAWNGLSLSDQDQLRSEETGEYQERLAEEARLRKSSMRADGRGERKQTMKHDEQVGILVKAVRSVLEDPEITKAEREDVLRETFDDYADRTGRSGLADIADVPTARPPAAVLKAGDCQELALAILQGKAAALRKAQPILSESQAFSRVYTDPSNAEIAQIERTASAARFAEQATQHGGGLEKNLALAKRDHAYEELKLKGEELRRADPLLTREGAIAKAMKLYPALAAAERAASRAALYA